MYKMITTGLLCIAAVALKAQDAPIDSVDHTKSNTLGASSTVYTNDLIKYQSATILTGLQGRLKGLNVSPFRGMQLLRTDANTKSDIVGAIPNVGGGIYGDNSEFLISARGQSPVAIVDGVERDLYSIDPEAIESVTIQKDALSNMFLGMRSSRGALIITTKNPDAKGGFHLSLTGKFGISSALKSGPNPLSAYQYAYLLNEALLNDGKSPLYTYDDFEAYRNGTSPYLHPDVNWKDAIMNNSTTSQAYNLNVTGGGRVAQYFVSLGYYSENGLFKTSDANSYNTNFKYNRYLITSKVNINVTDEFKVSMSLMGRIEEGNQPGGISGTGYSDLLSNVWQTPNNAYPVLNPNGTYGGNASYTQNLYAQTTGSGYISSNTRDVVGTINLKYDFDKLVRGLSVGATGNISSQVRNAIVRTKQAQVFQYSITQQGNEAYDKYGDVSSQTNSYRSVSTYQYMYGKMYVDWERQFGMHGVKASLWGDTRTILNNYDLPMIPSNIGQKVEYNYDNKYFAQAAVTESYYNRYDNGRRWGTFWAVSGGWRISNEAFLRDVSFLDDLKVRVGYGVTGNNNFSAGASTAMYSSNSMWPYNGTWITSYGPARNVNYDLHWEKKAELNVGLDYAFLNNRLFGKFDIYKRRVSGMLYNINVPNPPAVYETTTMNYGNLENTGWEFEIGGVPVKTRNFNWTTTMRLSHSSSKITSLWGNNTYQDRVGFPSPGTNGSAGRIEAGTKIGSYYIWKYAGITDNGRWLLYDKNDNVILSDKKTYDDKRYIGNAIPALMVSWDHTFTYKNLSLGINLRSWIDFDVFNTINMYYGLSEVAGQNVLRNAYIDNRHIKEVKQLCDYWLEDGTFLKIDAISLGYSLNMKKWQKYIDKIDLYLTVRNVACFTKYSGLNPEVNVNGLDPGYEWFNNIYPETRRYTFGMKIQF